MFCVCVCVFGIYVLKVVVERWFWELKMLFGSLVELHASLHSYLCFSLLEKLFLSNLDTSSTPSYLSSFSSSSYRNLDGFLTARWINWDFFWILDSFLTANGSIELPLAFCWFVPRQILDSCICWRFVFSTPGSTNVLIPLNTSICRDLLNLYI